MASFQPCVIPRERGPQSGVGGAVRQEPQMTTPSRQAAVWRSGQRLGQFVSLQMTVCCPQASSSRAGEPAGMVAKILGSIETQSREISCRHGIATFRREISPLRFASVEMTGVRGIVWGNLLPRMTVCCPPTSSSRAEERAGMGTKTLGSNETQSREISCHHGACYLSE